jgi:hypothetical protein
MFFFIFYNSEIYSVPLKERKKNTDNWFLGNFLRFHILEIELYNLVS